MSKARKIPSYVHHKATGQARVRIHGKDHYLGKYGSPESHEKYDQLISEHIANVEMRSSKTMNALLAAWWGECKRRYGSKGKGPYGNAVCWRPVIRLLRENLGEQRADDLRPKQLRDLIEAEAEKKDWSLTYAKMVLQRVRYIYKWAVAEELASLSTYQKLETIELRHGRQTESAPPVPVKLVAKTLRHVTPKIGDMIRLQWLTGMRPGEVVKMRPDEIDRTGDVWIYSPGSHKTKHRGKTRTIFLGPKAQRILAKWLLKAGDGFIFPVKAGKPYTSDSYRRAIHRTCETHGIERWSPYQLRKAAATRIRAQFDVEHAASVLGHSSATVTGDHYAAHDRKRAIAAVLKIG